MGIDISLSEMRDIRGRFLYNSLGFGEQERAEWKETYYRTAQGQHGYRTLALPKLISH